MPKSKFRTFVVFHEDYVERTRSLNMYRSDTLQTVLESNGIDYGDLESEEEAIEYINYYNGDGDHYWMINEILPQGIFKPLVK